MEKNTKQLKEHNIILKNREEISLSGVNEVVSFTDTQIILKTAAENSQPIDKIQYNYNIHPVFTNGKFKNIKKNCYTN